MNSTHTVMRSSRKGAAAARLGNGYTRGAFAAVGTQVDRGSADRLRKTQVLGPVTYNPRGVEIEAEGARCRRRHARPGLPAFARAGIRLYHAVRMIRREQKQVDLGPVLGQMLRDVLVYQGDIVDPVQPARNASLVRDQGNRDTCPVEAGDRSRRPVDEFDAINGAHVPVVDDDRAVTIEKDPGPQSRVPCLRAAIGHATFTVHLAGCLIRSTGSSSTRAPNG